MAKRFPPPVDDKEIMVVHGNVTHALFERRNCAFCQEVEQEYEKAVAEAGSVENLLAQMEKEMLP